MTKMRVPPLLPLKNANLPRQKKRRKLRRRSTKAQRKLDNPSVLSAQCSVLSAQCILSGAFVPHAPLLPARGGKPGDTAERKTTPTAHSATRRNRKTRLRLVTIWSRDTPAELKISGRSPRPNGVDRAHHSHGSTRCQTLQKDRQSTSTDASDAHPTSPRPAEPSAPLSHAPTR